MCEVDPCLFWIEWEQKKWTFIWQREAKWIEIENIFGVKFMILDKGVCRGLSLYNFVYLYVGWEGEG